MGFTMNRMNVTIAPVDGTGYCHDILDGSDTWNGHVIKSRQIVLQSKLPAHFPPFPQESAFREEENPRSPERNVHVMQMSG